MKEFWDDRYRDEEYAFGKEPNVFFREMIDQYRPKGSILMPAEGEGRNAVYAAKQGLEVFAFDRSKEGRKKAMRLADQEKIRIDYDLGEFTELPLFHRKFDAAALIYAHFEPHLVADYHQKIAEMIKPNGIVILEGFSTNHWRKQEQNPQVGGPKKTSMLFSLDQIRGHFEGLEPLVLEEATVNLQEGRFHQGEGTVIRFVGRKRV